MYSFASINGNKGIYDGIIKDSSVRYGRNAVNNYNNYLMEFAKPLPDIPNMKGIESLSSDEFTKKAEAFQKALDEINLPPIDFELRYQSESTPTGKVDVMSLLGAAYEEMGKNFSLGVKAFTEKLQKAFGKGEISAEALDTNGDNEIDIAEYSASILAADMMSTDSSTLSDSNITGTITNQGQNASLALINKNNYGIANQIFGAIYRNHNLGEAQQQFKNNLNNII